MGSMYPHVIHCYLFRGSSHSRHMAWQPGASSLGGNLRLNTERAWQQNMFSEKGQLSRQVRKEMEGSRSAEIIPIKEVLVNLNFTLDIGKD